MLYYLLAIFLLTIVLEIFYKAHIVLICPICAATVITWVVGLLAIHLYSPWANPLVVAILMGTSLGAVTEKCGKHFSFLWKMMAVLLAVSAIYFLVQPEELYNGLIVTAVLVAVTFLSNKGDKTKDERKDLFKDCC